MVLQLTPYVIAQMLQKRRMQRDCPCVLDQGRVGPHSHIGDAGSWLVNQCRTRKERGKANSLEPEFMSDVLYAIPSVIRRKSDLARGLEPEPRRTAPGQ